MPRPLSIVFVDDEIAFIDLLKVSVMDAFPGWEAYYFTNSVNALDFVRRHGAAIDIIVCDIYMPFASGIEILRIIKTGFPHIKRITLSGRLDTTSIIGADRHADVTLCKPFRLAELFDIIIKTAAAEPA